MKNNQERKFKEKVKIILDFILTTLKNIVFALLVGLAVLAICLDTYMVTFYMGTDINNFYYTFFGLINMGLFLNIILYLKELYKRRKR